MKKKKKKNTGNVMIILSLLLMIIIGIYTLLNSELFYTKNISIVGNKTLTEEDIIKKLDIKEDKNIFMYNLNKMEKMLKDNKYIEDVKVERKIPNNINIIINEKEIYAILREGSEYCYIDRNGDLIEKVKNIDGDKDIVKVDIEYIIEDENVVLKDNEYKNNLVKLLESLKENNLYKKINEINFEKSDIINMYTKEGIHIILNNDKNIDYNVTRASSIISDLQSNSKKEGKLDLTSSSYAIYTP